MTLTSSSLTRAAGASASAAGVLFIAVQIGHPHLDAASLQTTELVVRNTGKVLMCALALAGVTGLYLSQVRRNGVLGLVGYLVLAVGYLLMACTTFAAAYVLPEVAGSDPAYVDDVAAVMSGRVATADIGALVVVNQVQGIAYLAGGLLLGTALFRAGVVARWASVLLAVGGLVTLALAAMPDAFYRLLALPNGIAMIGLGASLWVTTRGADGTQRDRSGTGVGTVR